MEKTIEKLSENLTENLSEKLSTGDFDFKPLNDGLGFHRKSQPLDAEGDSDDTFSYSTLPGAPLGSERSEANSLLTGGGASSGSSSS